MYIDSLSTQEFGLYHRDGFLLVHDVASEEQCDKLAALARAYADQRFSIIMNLDRMVPEFRDHITNRKIVTAVEALFGKEAVAIMSQMVFKEPETDYAPQAWNPHQDNSYPKCRPGMHISVLTFLADSDPDNGGLYVYAGSHAEGLLPFEPVMSHKEKPGSNPGNRIAPGVLEKYEKVDLRIPKGSALLLHGECVHGSYPNTSNRPRPTFSGAYIPFGEPFWPGHPKRSDKRIILLHE